MKNRFILISFYSIVFSLLNFSVITAEQFNFDVTEMIISENGNKVYGYKKGTIKTDNGIIINADEFEYDKILNVLIAKGNVKAEDTIRNLRIYSNAIIYEKNLEKIFSKGNSKATYEDIIINANEFEYNKNLNILNAKGEVKIEDVVKNYIIYGENITYEKNLEKIFSKGLTEADIQSKYKLESSDLIFLKNQLELSSKNKAKILTNDSTLYKFEKFVFYINKKLLKASNVYINENISLPHENTDHLYFSEGFFNINEKSYIAGETTVRLKKGIFDNVENDPRLKGVSSSSRNGITEINKGIFTSCKKNDDCPPWAITAKKIKHDKNKKKLIYDNAILKLYNLPIVYFPKFFHPDPSVERQSGFLQPRLNNSEILGSSVQIPYFFAYSNNKDFTFKPTLFDSKIRMIQTEYRQENKNSSFISDFNLVQNYKSSLDNKKNSITHFFSKYTSDINLNNFMKSELKINIEKVSNDTYLKIFDSNIHESTVKPTNFNTLKSEINLDLEKENYNLLTGFISYENLQKKSSDRYEYVLPFYNFSSNIFPNKFSSIELISDGSNNLSNTNNLKTLIINDLNINFNDNIYENYGLKNNFNVYFKNLNTLGKNDPKYKDSPQSKISSMFDFQGSLPLKKIDEKYNNFLTPKMSLRISPFNMKNYSSADRDINTGNIFNNNRLGFNDTFEEGASLTTGINYKKENIKNTDNYIQFDVATIFRSDEQENLPSKSRLNKKASNIFGSVKYNFSETINLDYDFSLDNKFQTFEYNSLNANISINNFVTSFNFIEENGTTGNTNIIENTSSLNINENNNLTFKTRRNRKINLTEYYDLVYEYKNDCLTAGIKYRKTYYQDRDLKPGEDLMFTLTIYPLTTIEQKVDKSLYRN